MENPKIGIFKAPFPSTVNHYGILFKANALILMDEAAFTTAAQTIKN